ncbi:uncharacterized protein LOC112554503 [Pomacea canaliculata]|uniref:uncharacterized protein LOC112554503 n=1 Tax=Pomacea canaliculata TaxID=400727 RepID=UPI000D733CEB|nr:uncharacterized protein LOC112554503 [Pomacea canaliculata]
MTHEEDLKSVSALFLNSFRDSHFNPHKIGFNLSCTLSAEDNKTIEITALDLRLCSDIEGASNTKPCGQRMIITEPQNQPYVIDVTSNDDQGYLGLKKVYLSKTNQVTIQVQSDGIKSSLNVWLYVEPSGGKITGKCSAPILFTTTTTTTTTTAPSTATSISTRRRVITSTVHVSSPKTTTGIISGTTTTADGHLGHSGGEVGGEHYVNPDASSQLDQVLIYEKISVTGVWATFLIIFLFLIWAYRKLRAKRKQFRLGQTQSHEVPQMRNTKANVYATPPFSNSAYEPGRERISRHSYNLPQDVTRPPPLPPQQTKSRIYEKTPAPSVPTRVRAPDRPREHQS